MKNILRKTILTLLLIILLSACTANSGSLATVEGPQNNQPTEELSGFQANAILNEDLIFTYKTNEVFNGNAVMAFLQALEEGRQQFIVDEITYHFEPLSDSSYRIYRLTPIAESLVGTVEPVGGVLLSDELVSAIETAMGENELIFEHQGATYVLSESRKAIQISTISEAAIANRYFLEAYDPAYNEVIHTYNFVLNLELALQKNERSFYHDSDKYGILAVDGGYTISDSQSNLFAELSDIYVIPKSSGNSLPLGFKNLVREAIENGKTGFNHTDSLGVETEYLVEKLENSWSIKPAN